MMESPTSARKRSRPFILPAIVLGGAAVGAFLMVSVRAGAAPVPPTRLGINLPSPASWSETRSFNNIALYGTMQFAAPGQKSMTYAPQYTGPGGWPANLSGDLRAYIPLLVPQGARKGEVFHCSWKGQAVVQAVDNAVPVRADANNLFFALNLDARNSARGVTGKTAQVRLIIGDTSATAPFEDLDCREANRPRGQIYDPGFVRSLAPYKVVRFMDWMNANGGPVADFARETMPQRPKGPGNSVTLTNMIALATEAKIDPWFTIPYGADDAYIRQFAQMVHDRLPRDRTAYVELGNEMWNLAFGASQQAQKDGLAAGLSTNSYEAMLRQYGLKSKHMLDIWTQVFADNPKRLVRVISVQQYNTYSTNTIFGVPNVAKSVDAIATAPYFGNKLYPRLNMGPRPANLDEAFSKLKGMLEESLQATRDQKVIADKLGKRLLAYESGQHILIDDNVDLLRQINRDPRMGQIYKTFLDSWARDFGDTIMLYHQVGPVGTFGAWGLEEYDNQPLSEAPKKKAVLEFAAEHRQP
jgi:hypothetical protein